jgi:hypothetical protein
MAVVFPIAAPRSMASATSLPSGDSRSPPCPWRSLRRAQVSAAGDRPPHQPDLRLWRADGHPGGPLLRRCACSSWPHGQESDAAWSSRRSSGPTLTPMKLRLEGFASRHLEGERDAPDHRGPRLTQAPRRDGPSRSTTLPMWLRSRRSSNGSCDASRRMRELSHIVAPHRRPHGTLRRRVAAAEILPGSMQAAC